MEGGIFLCHWYFLLKAYLQKRRARGSQNQSESSEPPKTEERGDTETASEERDVALRPIFSSTSQENAEHGFPQTMV
jgi:hypothetical protein